MGQSEPHVRAMLDETYSISGTTYQQKAILQSHGCRWSPTESTWVARNLAIATKVAKALGVKVEHYWLAKCPLCEEAFGMWASREQAARQAVASDCPRCRKHANLEIVSDLSAPV